MRKRIRCITEPGKWILSKMAEESMRYVNGSIGTSPDPEADINYFMNYALVEPFDQGDSCVGAYFTHKEKKILKKWKSAEALCDFGVYMADRYKPKVPIPMKIHPPGIPAQFPIKDYRLNVGVAGRIYKSGRKGEKHVVKIDVECRNTICWNFLGDGWNSLPLSAKMKTTPWDGIKTAWKFYDEIDVLLCVSELEGGPIPNLEAMKIGVPLVSYDVGNSELWGEYAHLCNNIDDVIKELKRMSKVKRARYDAQQLDWKWFGREHAKLFSRVL